MILAPLACRLLPGSSRPPLCFCVSTCPVSLSPTLSSFPDHFPYSSILLCAFPVYCSISLPCFLFSCFHLRCYPVATVVFFP